MTFPDRALIIVCGLLLIVVIILYTVVWKYWLETKRKHVKRHSILYNNVKFLNKNTLLHRDIDKLYSFEYRCRTSQEFNRIDIYDCFCDIVYENRDHLLLALAHLKENVKNYSEYELIYNHLLDSIDKEGLGKNYRSIEMELLKSKKRKAITEAFVEISVHYTSPQGRNHRVKSQQYPLSEIEKAIEKKEHNHLQQVLYKASTQYERSRMTPTLRYAVMQRDRFRCQICGASQEDGVRLHVDHIFPISKGGKTEMANLRTLCETCNLGKRDSYSYDGVN